MSTKHTIPITDETIAKLNEHRSEGQSYDEVINEIIEEKKIASLFARSNRILAETDEDDWVPLEEA